MKHHFMKKLFFLLSLSIFTSALLRAQADKITGYWLTEEGTSQVRVYKAKDGQYYGKITWLDEPYENGKPKVDDENPDPGLRNRPIMGLQILEGLEYSGKDKEWKNGTIYDPKSGKTYDCYMWFEDNPETLYMRGFVMGMRWLGRSSAWTREENRNN